jgi:acetylglutamate kinase
MGVATGGMQAKLNAASAAQNAGVDEIEIAPGASPQVLARLFDGELAGTKIVRTAQRVTSHD